MSAAPDETEERDRLRARVDELEREIATARRSLAESSGQRPRLDVSRVAHLLLSALLLAAVTALYYSLH